MPEEFDPLRYIASYSDLIQVYGADPVSGRWHWVHYGQAEGRDPFRFNPFFYGASNPDLIPLFGSYYTAYTDHYIRQGFAAGRSTTSFDYLGYSASNSDLLVTFGTNASALAQHYIDFGYNEGRSFNRFDPYLYGASNPDVAAAFGDDRAALLGHYINYGFYEGRPTSGFDPIQYVAANKDLLLLGYQNYPDEALRHYLQTGADEGRPTDFDERAYILTYSDLAANALTDEQALSHWMNVGVHEGRVGDALFGHDQASHTLPGDVVAARFDRPGDRDWFAVDLTQGELAVFKVSGASGIGTITLHDQQGRPLTTDRLSGGGLDYMPTSSGRYYVVVTSEQTSDYSLLHMRGGETLSIGGRNYSDADFAGLQNIRYLETRDHYETVLGPNAQNAGIRFVNAISNAGSITDASAYTVGITVDVRAGGADVVRTGSADDQVLTGNGAQTITLGNGNDFVDGPITSGHLIDAGSGYDVLRSIVPLNVPAVVIDLARITGFERFESNDLMLTATGPYAGGTFDIIPTGSFSQIALQSGASNPLSVFNVYGHTGWTALSVGLLAGSVNFFGGTGDDWLGFDPDVVGRPITAIGGAGLDRISVRSGLASDEDFAGLSGFELLVGDNIRLGELAAQVGFQKLELDPNDDNHIVFESGFDANIETTLLNTSSPNPFTAGIDSGVQLIDAGQSDAPLNLRAVGTELQATDTVIGSRFTTDVMNVDYWIFSRPIFGNPPTPNGVDLTGVSGVDTINITIRGSSLRPMSEGWIYLDTQAGEVEAPAQTINVIGVTLGAGEDLIYAPIDASAATADLVVNGASYLKSGSGDDVILAAQLVRTIIEGNGGNDSIIGGAQLDQITGGAGNDVITGGGGADQIDGGADADRFRYTDFLESRPVDPDRITGFVSGSDVVDVTDIQDPVYDGHVISFRGNAPTLAAAQALLTPRDGTFDAVYQQDAAALWFDNGDGVLDANDLQIILPGVAFLTGADVLDGTMIVA
jgi:serralysin